MEDRNNKKMERAFRELSNIIQPSTKSDSQLSKIQDEVKGIAKAIDGESKQLRATHTSVKGSFFTIVDGMSLERSHINMLRNHPLVADMKIDGLTHAINNHAAATRMHTLVKDPIMFLK